MEGGWAHKVGTTAYESIALAQMDGPPFTPLNPTAPSSFLPTLK
jgi:hypothetical protein